MELMRKGFLIACGALVAVAMSGCSVFMAANQPRKRNLNVLAVGSPRSLVLAELGAPVSTEMNRRNRVDVYAFRQGYSRGVRTTRAVGHGVADFLTLGIWEVVGTPTEAFFDGEETLIQVQYDAGDKVVQTMTLKRP
jgi:outer membrane protein assembly factor BamE (lipoprotein component of BamABCDE complex)